MSNQSNLNQDQSNTGGLKQDEMLENKATGYAVAIVAKVIGVPESTIRDWIRINSSLTDEERKCLDDVIKDGQQLEKIGEEHSIATKYNAVRRCTTGGDSVEDVCKDLHLPKGAVEGWVKIAEEIKKLYNEAFKGPQVGIQHNAATSQSETSTSMETDEEGPQIDDALLLLEFSHSDVTFPKP